MPASFGNPCVNIRECESLEKIYYLGSCGFTTKGPVLGFISYDVKMFFTPKSKLFDLECIDGERWEFCFFDGNGTAGVFFPIYYPVDEKLFTYSIYNANITYYLNYNEGEEDVYWFDDCDNELITYIPIEPIREGYTFKGWYKETECVNEWNFDVDIVPGKQYDIEGNYIYRETKLFAKWE